jgi:hypothetical protein
MVHVGLEATTVGDAPSGGKDHVVLGVDSGTMGLAKVIRGPDAERGELAGQACPREEPPVVRAMKSS